MSFAVNTHVHADHITASGRLKEDYPKIQSLISNVSAARADIAVEDGFQLNISSRLSFRFMSTPGHTNGCMSIHVPALGVVLTGDTLLIDGCGRTDFQEGDPETLYSSIHSRLYSLPAETIVLPAHDYKGQRASTVRREMRYNARTTKPKAEFVRIMRDLDLSYPRAIDVAVPANMQCGVQTGAKDVPVSHGTFQGR
jgi:sulfur dioxygenase